jgi:hypothetical protein
MPYLAVSKTQLITWASDPMVIGPDTTMSTRSLAGTETSAFTLGWDPLGIILLSPEFEDLLLVSSNLTSEASVRSIKVAKFKIFIFNIKVIYRIIKDLLS